MIGYEDSFEHHSGDTRTLEITTYDEGGVAGGQVLDISAASIIWALSKKNPDSTSPKGSALITKSVSSGITVVDGPNGRYDVRLDAADTEDLGAGEYYFESQMTLNGEVSTVVFGVATIYKDLI